MKHIVSLLVATLLTLNLSAQNTTESAQPSDENPLFQTTGANVIGAGKIEMSGSLDYFYFNKDYPQSNPYHLRSDIIGANLGFRFGVGHRAEFNISMAGSTSASEYNLSRNEFFSSGTFTPSVGARLLLFGGRRWIPTVTFHTQVYFPMSFGSTFGSSFQYDVQPLIALQFRNRIGQRWALDYSLGYMWGQSVPAYHLLGALRYSLFARCLITDRFMLGFGIENSGAKIEALWQLKPNLQLKAQSSFSAAFGGGMEHIESYSLIGINWMIK
ncbi:MAG: hypothetical protein J5526_03815 [Bacteroidales bacterium]|nr:hypothetical protein [Bacteroidales bacterium]